MNNRHFLILGCAALVAACATTTDPAFQEGRNLLAEGKVEEGLERIRHAVDKVPSNAEYRSYLANQKERIITQLLAQAQTARINGQYNEADLIYQRALRIDPGNHRLATAMAALALDRRHEEMVRDAENFQRQGQLDKAQVLLRRILSENPRHREAKLLARQVEEVQNREVAVPPKLKSLLSRPITLEFRDANLRAVFEVISRTAGINFVFDKDVRPDLKTTIFVTDTTIEDALQLLLATNQLEKKVLSENSIMVYPNTPAKQRDYQDLVMKSFYLANADVKQAGNMIRTMLKTRDVFVDERLNLLMIRDTPEAVRVAERLIASQDLAEPEAILEVEVLEVSRSRLESLGVQWPKQIGYGLVQGAQETTVLVNGVPQSITTNPGGTVAQGVIDLHNRGGLTTFIANPALLLNINAQDTSANVLANPRIRVKNREKAKIHIGDKVPVLTSTATSTGFVSQSITYLDVGVKLDVEPNIGLDDDVTMKVGLEVSSIAREITNTSGTVAYQVGTRAAGTVLRLKDGETQVLAGLIQDEDRRNANKIPGLGDMPLLGRLFSTNNDTNGKTEIVLLITPRIVRSVTFPPASVTEFSAGTESGIGRGGGGRGNGGGPISEPQPVAPPPAPETPSPAPTPAPEAPAPAPAPDAPPSGGEPAAPAPAPLSMQ